MRFRDLSIGDSFDFISGNPLMDSFYGRCTKTSARTYEWPSLCGKVYRVKVGSINALVYHVTAKAYCFGPDWFENETAPYPVHDV
jgi:hypothetical protein